MREFEFKDFFSIPQGHRLETLRSRSRAGVLSGTYWEHEKLDECGRLVARFERYDERGADGIRCSGWRKYDPDGRLMEECQPLVPAEAVPAP